MSHTQTHITQDTIFLPLTVFNRMSSECDPIVRSTFNAQENTNFKATVSLFKSDRKSYIFLKRSYKQRGHLCTYVYDLRVPTSTLNFAITFYRKSKILFISETVVILKSTLTSTFTTYDL